MREGDLGVEELGGKPSRVPQGTPNNFCHSLILYKSDEILDTNTLNNLILKFVFRLERITSLERYLHQFLVFF